MNDPPDRSRKDRSRRFPDPGVEVNKPVEHRSLKL